MLDLKPGVHFEEVEFSSLIEEKLDGAGADIADGPRGRDCGVAHSLPQFGRDRGRGGLLDDFLMAALNRAIALAEMDDVAVLVGKHLKLDVAGVVDRTFEDQLARAERARRLGAS